MAKILIVDDDTNLCSNICQWLEFQRYIVETCHSGHEALARVRGGFYDAVILDWNLPGASGIDICRAIRGRNNGTRILMLTGKNSIADKETGFDAGADDYLTKPFIMKELELRIRALLKRPIEAVVPILSIRNIVLDRNKFSVTFNGEAIHLLPREFALLEFFMRHPNQVFSARAILERLWSLDADVTEEAVISCLRRLRKKVDTDPQAPLIVTVHGVGYKLIDVAK